MERRERPGRRRTAAALGCALALGWVTACEERAREEAAQPSPAVSQETPAARPAPAPERPEAAAEAVALLQQRLGAALREALAESPQRAIEVCRVEAPTIAAELQRPGLAVGRTSHRLRNPANAPGDWMLPFLEEFRGSEPQPGAFRTVSLGARGTGYVEPIYLQPMCATCHGTNVDPELLATIRAHYPEDRAVGFEVGELRGLFWVILGPDEADAGS